jgi:hypothetical protein
MPDHIGGAAAEALGRIQTQAALDGLVKGFETLQEFWFYSFRTADHDWLMGSVTSILHFRILEALETVSTCTPLDIRTPINALADRIVRSVPIDSDRGILLDNDDYEKLVGRVMALGNCCDDYIEACLNVLEEKPGDAAKMSAVSDSPPAVSTGVLEKTSRAANLLAVLVREQTKAEHRERIRNVFEVFRKQEPSRERSWTCYMLARALGRMKDKESIPLLLSALNDEKKEFEFGSPSAPNIFLTNAMTPVHRASAAAALGMIGDPVALPSLLAAAENFDNMMDVRDAAATAIIDIGRKIDPQTMAAHKDFAQRLKTVAETYPELYPGKTLFKDFTATDQIPKRSDLKIILPSESVKERLYKQQGGMCNACGVNFELRNLEIDHIVPKSKGGGDYYENYQLLCGSCNRIKGDRPMEYLRLKIETRERMMKDKIFFGE